MPNYPVPWYDDDARMTEELLNDVRTVLLRHGYPDLTRADLGLLEVMLVRFIYAPRLSLVKNERVNPASVDLNVMAPPDETPMQPTPSDAELADAIDRWYEEHR